MPDRNPTSSPKLIAIMNTYDTKNALYFSAFSQAVLFLLLTYSVTRFFASGFFRE
jgi:hypothetical protein